MNKYIIVLISILLILYVASYIADLPVFVESYSLTGAEIFAVIIMMGNGTFMDTVYYKIFRFVIVVVIIGFLFKILHLTGADELISISLPAAALVYFLHFLAKKEKRLLDILKILTAITFFTYWLVSMLHIISSYLSYEINFIPHALFWITFICFIISGYKKKTLFKY